MKIAYKKKLRVFLENRASSLFYIYNVLTSCEISEKSNDFRDLVYSKNKKSQLAVNLFSYGVSKYIGAYISVLEGVDQIIFTGGIGQNSAEAREKILENFSYLGIKLDKAKNRRNSKIISSKDSKVQVLCIPANEKLVMAKEVFSVKN